MPFKPPQYVPPGAEAARKASRQASDQARGTASQRGYGYSWQQIRLIILNREPLCRPCKARGLTVEATCVDHIVAKVHGGTDDPANLQPMCARCNAKKSVGERRDRQQWGGTS